VANSSMLGLVGKGQTVRGWCLTGMNPLTPYLRNNHINGYNLILDDGKFATNGTSQQGLSTGAIPFRFITPMPNTQYKIFCQPRSCGSPIPLHMFTHALDTTQYPKTVNGFWVRFGYLINSTVDTFATTGIVNRPAFGEILNRSGASATYQLQVVVI
jgi:hypothetical protein